MTAVVALWVALQLAAGALFAPALVTSPQGEPVLAARASHDVVLTRAGDRPLHRPALQSPPSLPPQRASATPPDAIAATVEVPRAQSKACTRHARFAGPRGPPHVVAS